MYLNFQTIMRLPAGCKDLPAPRRNGLPNAVPFDTRPHENGPTVTNRFGAFHMQAILSLIMQIVFGRRAGLGAGKLAGKRN